MAGPLLQTKLHIPRRRHGAVARPRLAEHLDRGAEGALTLVSAPAGFGKTTLLTEWLATGGATGQAVAWLSLDERDNDPTVFWTYVVAALRSAAEGVGAGALALLQSPQSSTDAVLATLVNELSEIGDDVVLVLDDYHLIHTAEVHHGLTFLIEHLPAQIHLVIASRADPALPLARLRARGDLVELRATDLRFTAEEAADYLTEAMRLRLTAGDVAVLEGRTEGWIAALQLAALSLQGRDDPAGFIADFAGDDRYIVDYLVEEVLARQSDQVRSFLLQTSVLTRLTGPLCDAVTGTDGGKAMLEALDRANLFLVPLDDRRRWYRYHHLFADVLQAYLHDEQPDAVAGLHRRAGDWHAANGERAEAAHHALAGGDAARAADLIELMLPALQQGRQEATIRRWLAALPADVLQTRPVLSIGYTAALMVSGEIEGVEAHLRDAERWVIAAPGDGQTVGVESAGMVVVDADAFRRVPSAISLYRAGQALLSGNTADTIRHARTALDLAGDDDHLSRGPAAGLLGLAYWTGGDLEAGYRWYADCAAHLERAGHLSDVAGCTIALADIRIAQGRLRDAMSTLERVLRLVTPETGPVLRGAADLHVALAGVLIERGDLEAARGHLTTSRELGEHAGLPQTPYRWLVAMARMAEAEGDLDGALAPLDEAQFRYAGDYFPDVRPVAAVRARLLARHGRWADVLAWAAERGLTVEDAPEYLREFEHVTLARGLVAQAAGDGDGRSLSGAVGLLNRVQQAAEVGGRTGGVLDVLVVRALAEQARGDMPAAHSALQRALTLAEAHGHVRLFADEGPGMAVLLKAAAKGTSSGYARRLLEGLDAGDGSQPRSRGPAAAQAGLVEPLSARELDVLRLLGTHLDGPAIARELYVSLNTVRTHTKNIYAKLGVNDRGAAVRRAQELDLMPRLDTHEPRTGVAHHR
ncbi:LuxR C-terminal-related transcriptional regulator [Modestobacter altitudinis]|uniref:LuxR C-terminal-related transcriptional regulator n=1 Tax=Modestobacter altitudinis TaxID=2213158 RepID=UPI00110CFCF4|nr:LuxR C-terminal-related transcriptional regulator [Modestobacter altitudinis]